MKAGATGGIETVVKAINTHIDNADVCKQGCGALLRMTENDSKNDTLAKQTTQLNGLNRREPSKNKKGRRN